MVDMLLLCGWDDDGIIPIATLPRSGDLACPAWEPAVTKTVAHHRFVDRVHRFEARPGSR
jgi:hypothetical protein